MAFFAPTPESNCPLVTTGLYPPQLIPLLNAAIIPRVEILFHEKGKFTFIVRSVNKPTTIIRKEI